VRSVTREGDDELTARIIFRVQKKLFSVLKLIPILTSGFLNWFKHVKI
jgi:hypothetical protein